MASAVIASAWIAPVALLAAVLGLPISRFPAKLSGGLGDSLTTSNISFSVESQGGEPGI